MLKGKRLLEYRNLRLWAEWQGNIKTFPIESK